MDRSATSRSSRFKSFHCVTGQSFSVMWDSGLITWRTSDVNLALRNVDLGLDKGEKALIARELKRGYENKYREQMSLARDMERPWNYHGTMEPWNHGTICLLQYLPP